VSNIRRHRRRLWPVDFSLDSKGDTIDLSDANKARLREVLALFATAARRAGGSARRSSASPARSSGPSRSREQTQAMRGWLRGWLRDNGYNVKDRGHVPAEFVAA
jgi:Lsr2